MNDQITLGTLIGFRENGQTPLVEFRGQLGTAAVPARAIVDLQGKDVGREVVLVFLDGDVRFPIVMGLVRQADARSVERPSNVEVEADGQRLVVTAKESLVLRCGRARITLTSAGKVLIDGSYVSTRSTGVNRIRGGSVQLN